jgi:starvation-inducible DNA-binding protein
MNLSKEDIKISVDSLSKLLADTYLLSLKTQNFHWNVEDPRFYMLHDFFAKQYEMLTEAIDEIAERIRMLGEYAPGSMAAYLELATIKEARPIHDGDVMLQQLTEDHYLLIGILRKSIELIGKTQDQGTLDFLINCLQQHEKMAWMTKSHSKA